MIVIQFINYFTESQIIKYNKSLLRLGIHSGNYKSE